MATYYVNLSEVTNGHAGNIGDPYSFTDWQGMMTSVSESSTFYMKGTYDGTDPVWLYYSTYTFDFVAWDIAVNGPWKINTTGQIQLWFTNVNGAIIRRYGSQTYDLGKGILRNSYFINDTEAIASSGNSLIEGCIIYTIGIFNVQYSICTINDCMVYAAGGNNGMGNTINVYNSAFNSGTFTGFNFISGCQTDWVPPAMPAWDAAQSAFLYSTLSADIDSPPQPGIGSPTYTGYETDLWGNPRKGIGTGYMPAVPPVWASTYPKAGTVGGRTAEILVQTNETGMAYFVALPDGDTGPSSAQVKDGLNSIGVTGAVGMYGSVHLDADTEASMGATGLTSETAYDLWIVAENDALDLQEFPTGINITTTDITPPSWEPTNPVTQSFGSTGANFTVGIGTTGTAYFVAVPNNETGPSSAQVKVGLNYAGVTGAQGLIGSIALIDGETGTLEATNLAPSTAYDVYLVAEDNSLNLQETPVKLDLTTQGPPVITVQPTPQTADEGTTGMLTLTATGDPAITSYQWYKDANPLSNGGRISGVDTDTLFITDLTMANAGEYYAEVGNGELPITQSSTVQLDVTNTSDNILDLPGDISVHKFQIAIGTAPLSGNHVTISYTGTANPVLTADLTSYEYSLNGSTWETMTPQVGTVTTGLSFTTSGASFTFVWMIKTDMGDNIYNRGIQIRLQATSSDMTTTMMSKSLLFEKLVMNMGDAGSNRPKLPDDYSGISGGDLLANAPKVKT